MSMYTNKTDEYRCTLCNKEIELEKNLTGLVINDDIFICQHCCSTNPKNMLLDWINQKTDNAPNFRPIVSWLEDRKL